MCFTSGMSYTPPIGYSRDHVMNASVGLSYYVWDNHAFNIMADGYHLVPLVQLPPRGVWGASGATGWSRFRCRGTFKV